MKVLAGGSFWDRIFRNADGGAGGGGGDPAPASGDGGTPPPAGGDGGTPPAGGEGAAQLYRPDGLGEQYHGETDHQTIDKLFEAVRSRGDVPADVAAYREFGDISDELKPYYASIENDGMFDAVANKALELGVTTTQLHGILGAYMTGAAEMGLLEPAIDVSAERLALLPDEAKSLPKQEQDRRIDQRMNDNLGWVEQMVQRGLPKDAAKHMQIMLGDTADGHRAIEFFRSQMSRSGEARPASSGNGAPAGGTADALRARSAMPENTPGHAKFSKASYDQLDADYRAAYPE